MLWSVVIAVCLSILLSPVTSFSPRFQWIDSDDILAQALMEEPTSRMENRELGDELMAEKRALSVLSRWKPFTDTFRSSGLPSRSHIMSELLPRGVEVVSAETRGTLRPHGQPLRWGRRR
ncbi:hypothetical protein J6590_060405 [Homalodisca vitripennis]|nr:hypothetical protein J6590_060405 [Homalodisca vitripennis]